MLILSIRLTVNCQHFRCIVANCRAAFTTKQCLQFHYKKVHNFTEDDMPKIERSVDYTFQAYSGSMDKNKENEGSKQGLNDSGQGKESESENESKLYQELVTNKKFHIYILRT